MKPISLLYHDIVSADPGASGFLGPDADSYKLDVANFASHLENIADFAPLNSTVFTFDDGGVSAYERTAGLLETHGWRGHFFIVTSKIDAIGFLSPDQIRDLHRRGHHIGSHSHTHPACFSQLPYDTMIREWRESRRILADILGELPNSVSVPGGFYSRDVARAARETGYTVLFNSEPTSRVREAEGLKILGRFGIKRHTTPAEALALARGDWLPQARQALSWNAKKPLKRAGGKIWFAARRWFFATNSAK